MNNGHTTKICEEEGTTCKKEVRALCFHCSKHLCRIHLIEHAQLIEYKTRTELHSLADRFNEVSLKFDRLSISDDILEKPFAQLEKWRVEAHEKIDQIAENKRQELRNELDKYRNVLLTKTHEQLVKINISKKMITDLVQEGDASGKQITDLQESINQAENYLKTLPTPTINVTSYQPTWSVNVYTNFSDVDNTFVHQIREFPITYIRLNGIIKNYYIKTKTNGKMSDLIEDFVRHYTAIEEFTEAEKNGSYMSDHLPKNDFILAIEVQNHRCQLLFNENTSLKSVKNHDVIVFYETSHSLFDSSNPTILMPCNFRRISDQTLFGWPIYLNVPRIGCHGQHVLNALHDLLDKFFAFDFNTDGDLYEAFLTNIIGSTGKEIKLNAILYDEIDFSKVNATLFVNIADHIADKYERNTLTYLNTY